MEEMNNTAPSIYNAFKAFLEMIYNVKKQDVVFDDYYKRSDIPSHIITQRPLLMDPTNPYNNLFDPKKKHLNTFYGVMMKCADRTLDLLRKGSRDIQEIFFPQGLLPTQCEEKNLVKSKNYQVGVFQAKGKKPPLKPIFVKGNAPEGKFYHYFEALLQSYAAVVYNLSKGEKKSNDEITNAVKEFVDKVNGNKGLWKPHT